MDFERGRLFGFVLLAAVLAFSFNQVYRVHYGYTGLVQLPHSSPNYANVTDFSYPYPIHADEWMHLAQAVYIMDSGTPGFTNPYDPELAYRTDLESGYHIFLALFFTVTGMDPVFGYQYLPATFFVLNSLLLFLFVRRFSGNYYIALLSILFLLVVPSNINIMGNWFAVPMTFTLFMVYGFLISFDRMLKKRELKFMTLSGVIFVLLALSYPFAAMLVTAVTVLYVILEFRLYGHPLVKKHRIWLLPGMAALLALAFYNLPQELVFSKSWTSFHYDYSLIVLYGLIPSLLSVIGIFFVLKKKMNIMFVLWPAVLIVNLIVFRLSGNAFFIPYERTLYYLMVGLAPVAAAGFYFLLSWIHGRSLVVLGKTKWKSHISVLITFAVAFLVLAAAFSGYYEIKERELVIMYPLQDYHYDAIKFIGDNYGPGNVVMADPLVSSGVYPISRNQVVVLSAGQLSYGDTAIAREYMTSDCGRKSSILFDKNFDFVIGKQQDCIFTEEVYGNSEVSVYRVIP